MLKNAPRGSCELQGGFIVNNLKRYSKGILVAALVITSIVTGTVLNHFAKADNTAQNDASSVKRDTSISVDSSGNLQIERTKKEEKIMGKEDAWTIMIYMDGMEMQQKI